MSDPELYSVFTFYEKNQIVSIERKPTEPKSDFTVPELYFYNNNVIEIAKNIKPSPSGDLEIMDINAEDIKNGKLKASVLNEELLG